MKKNYRNTRIIMVVVIIIIIILLSLAYYQYKKGNFNNNSEPTYKITKYYLNESDLLIMLNKPALINKIYLSTGCNSLSLFFYFGLKNESNNTITGSVGIAKNTSLVAKAFQIMNPKNIPNFEQDNMSFYSLNASNLRFEQTNLTGLNSWINLNDYCLAKKVPKQVIINAPFTKAMGFIDENGTYHKY